MKHIRLSFFKILFIGFLEGREGKGGGNIDRLSRTPLARPPLESPAHNADRCPGWELNRQPPGPQAGTQSTFFVSVFFRMRADPLPPWVRASRGEKGLPNSPFCPQWGHTDSTFLEPTYGLGKSSL